jgi:hypothetical protein
MMSWLLGLTLAGSGYNKPKEQTMTKREFEVKYGLLLASLGATVKSLAHEDNVKDITDEQWEEIEAIYDRLHLIQRKVVCGY